MIRYLYEIVPSYLPFFFTFFYEVYSRIYFCPLQLTYSYATMVSVKSMGTTYEGRHINMVTVSLNPSAKSTKPAIFLECGIHAREWVSPATCLYAIDELIGSGQNGLLGQCKYSVLNLNRPFCKLYFLTFLCPSDDFYIIPVTNPDGYAYTWDGNRMWRKNRRPSSKLLLRTSARQFWPTQGLPGYPGQ